MLVACDDVDRGDPDPEGYLTAAVALGFPAGECLVVEDAEAGLDAGRAAGARTAGAPGELIRASPVRRYRRRVTTRAAAARAFYMVLAVFVAVALAVQVVLIVQGGTDVNSGESGAAAPLGTRLVRLVTFFTIECNALVLVLAASLALDPRRDGRLWRVLHLDALLGIAVTGVVFFTVLAPIVQLTGLAYATNVAFHYVTPVAVVLGWLVFGPRPRVDGVSLVAAAVWPAAWIAWTMAYGAITGWYPYPFLNVDRLGAAEVTRNLAFVAVGAVVVALLVWWADRRLSATGPAQVSSLLR